MRLSTRNHFREIRHTPETPDSDDLERLGSWREALGNILAAEIPAEKSWYKAGPADIPILAASPDKSVDPLSDYSSVMRSMEPIRQVRLFVRPERREEATSLLAEL